MPFELRPYPEETLRPEGEYLRRAWAERILPLAERMGLKMVLPRVSPQPHTHLAFEGFQYAKEHGKAGEYNHAVFAAFFQEEQDIGEIEVLAGIAGSVGLDREEFRRALETRRYKEAHENALMMAVRKARVEAVPMIVIGSRVIRGLATREAIEEMIREEMERGG
jgi:predicted DsbA family dithiol-disulfide isomerase